MKSIKCIAIDDEPLALTILEKYVSKVPFLNMIQTFTNPLKAISFIQKEKPELLFLDIQMPEIHGTEFIKILDHKPLIIFTTAYPEYALDGFNLDVIDYLLKPIPFDRFVQAVNKAVRLFNPEDKSNNNIDKGFLFVRQGYKSVKINFEDMLYIEGLREYVTIYTSSFKVLKLDTLKNMEQILPSKNFVRVHKSYIVNISYVKATYGNTLEIGNKQIPIGRAFKEIVNKYFS